MQTLQEEGVKDTSKHISLDIVEDTSKWILVSILVGILVWHTDASKDTKEDQGDSGTFGRRPTTASWLSPSDRIPI